MSTNNTTETIEPQELRSKLPDAWDIEADGDQCLYAYATGYNDKAGIAGAVASVEITATPVDGVWTAVWMSPGARRVHEPEDNTTAAKVRCIEWVVSRADQLHHEQTRDAAMGEQ